MFRGMLVPWRHTTHLVEEMDTTSATDSNSYAIFFVDRGGAHMRPSEWPGYDLCPERIRVVRDGVMIGEVPVSSGDGRFDADDLGRFQIRYAWIDDDQATSYAPGDFDRGWRERGGLPETVALYRRDDDGRYMFVHEEQIGWPPSFRRRGWPDRAHVSLATMVEYMDGEIDTLPLEPPPRRPGVPDVAR